MKRKFILFTSLFFFLSAFLQVNAQKVRVIDNKGTLKSLNRVTVGSTPHTEPTEGDIWFDTSATTFDVDLRREYELKIYNDGSWIKLSENIYNADGRLTYHRKIRGNGNNLTFERVNKYKLDARKIDINSYEQPITLNPRNYDKSDPINYGIIAEGPFWGKKAFRDSSGNVGTNGQILSSVSLGTEQGTSWIDAPTNINTTITNTVVGNKIADYTNENGIVTPINETITSISQSASNTNTQVAANTANTIATYTNENGSNTTINETITSLSFRTSTSGSPTVNTYFIDYLDEKGTTNNIDLSGLVYKGKPGSVFFAGKNGTIAEDNDHLFWDIDKERLYIGAKLSGTNKLNVAGTTRTQGINNSNGSTTRPSYRFTEDSNTGMFRPSADNLAFATGGTETIRINASQNVGIGTTTPEKKLDVNGEVKIRTINTGDITTDNIIVAGTDGVLKNIPVTDIQSEVTITPAASGMASRTTATHSAGGTTTVTNIYETVTVLTDTNTATDKKTIAIYQDENGSVSNIQETITDITQADSNTLVQVNNATPTANTIATYTKEDGDTITINETVTSFTQNQPGTITSTTTDPNAGDITYINEKGATQKANIVSSDTNNSIKVGTDGGAYLQVPVVIAAGTVDYFVVRNSWGFITSREIKCIRNCLGIETIVSSDRIDTGRYKITLLQSTSKQNFSINLTVNNNSNNLGARIISYSNIELYPDNKLKSFIINIENTASDKRDEDAMFTVYGW